MSYIPPPEKLLSLGYLPDARHTVPEWELTGYSRKVWAPVKPWQATLVLKISGRTGMLILTRYARSIDDVWRNPVPNELFFDQMLQAVGWPIEAGTCHQLPMPAHPTTNHQPDANHH
jgi:hypothetical protein